MEFTVFGNILSNQSQSRVTLEKLCVEFWQCDSTVTENISEYCKFHSSDLGKNQCKQGIKFLQLKCHIGYDLACLMRQSIVNRQ